MSKKASDVSIKVGDVTNTGGQILIGNFSNVTATLERKGQANLARALENLTNAVLNSNHINETDKKEQIEVITQIGEEATKPTPNKMLLKTLSDGLFTALKSIPDVAKAVSAIIPLLPL